MRKTITVDISRLIETLQQEQALGAASVTLCGTATLMTDRSNSVIMTTEPQM